MSSGITSGSISLLPPAEPVTAADNDIEEGETLYTVPTGKTFYCYGGIIGNPSTTANIGLKVDLVQAISLLVVANGSVPFGNGFVPVFIATSGQVITLSPASGINNTNVTIWGFLQ